MFIFHGRLRLLVVVINVCATLAICSCELASSPAYGSVSDAQDAVKRQAALTSLLDYDFSDDIKGQILIDWRGASEEVNAIVGIKALTAVSRNRQDEDILGVKMVGDLYSWTLNDTIAMIAQFVAKNGEVPSCGADLFGKLNESDTFIKCTALVPTQRMIQFGPGVNMATSKFYSTFSNPSWHPGGIYVEILDRVESGVFQHNNEQVHFGSDADPENVDGACYIKVFSAAANHVLYEDYVTYECREIAKEDEG